MRGSIKIGKKQYFADASSTSKKKMLELAEQWRSYGEKVSVRKGRGTASKEYILYVLPRKPVRR